MKILLLTDGITPYNIGGMQNHSYLLTKLLAQNNCKITLVHCGFFNNINFFEDYADIFSPSEIKNITPVFIPFMSNGKIPGHYIKESKLYSENIKKHFGINLSKFDLIYAQGFTGWNFLNNNQNIPVIVNLHGLEMFQKAPSNRVKLEHYILKPFVKQIIKKADYLLSFGGQIDNILEVLKVDNAKIIKQSNGIEKNWIKKTEPLLTKTRTFTFIGRYERRKGIEELTAALVELIKKDLKFQFNFIGPIPKKHQITHPKIKYLGEIKDLATIKQSLDQSDFLVSPSYSEGMPTVILEAMARGNAIIATNVGANSKMIDTNGWLIDCSKTAIIKSILKATNMDNSELLEMKKQSLMKVKTSFTWENVIKDQLQCFKEIISK